MDVSKVFLKSYYLQILDEILKKSNKFSPKSLVEKFREMQTKKKTYKIENKGNYDLVNIENGQPYYLLSDKGTFIIENTLSIEFWKPLFEEDGVYQVYTNQFDQIKDSIKVI